VRASRVARRGREVVAGRGRDPVPPAVNWPEWARRSFRLHLRGLDPARGDMVIGAFVLARLLGIRLLTLEARVIVHENDRDGTGPGQLVLTPVPPDRPAPYPARPERRVRLDRRVLPDRDAPPDRPVPQGRPDPSRRPGSMSAGSERLARAVWLVEQGADTLERTRRVHYRG
jgi:hypothetical protein